MRRLDELFDRLARRGRHFDPDAVIDRLERRLSGEAEAVALQGRDDMRAIEHVGRKRALVAVGAALIALLAIGVPAWLVGGGDEGIDAAETPPTTEVTATSSRVATTSMPPGTTTLAPTTTAVPPSTSPTQAPDPPALGFGWEIVAENPGGFRFLPGRLHRIPDVGLVLVDEAFPVMAMYGDSGEWVLVEIESAESVGLAGVIGSSAGMVAYGQRCRSSNGSCTPGFWVSADGITWTPVVEDGGLFMGCREIDGECHVSIGGAAAAPDGRIVVLGIDPAVSCGDGCYDLTTVAWSSADGLEWERHEFDLEGLLPEGWQGMYDLQDQVVHTGTTWLAYVTLMSDPAGTVLLESVDGIRWSAVETGSTFAGVGIQEITVGEQGVLATDGVSVWFSSDLSQWVRTDLSTGWLMLGVFDEGFVAAAFGEQSEEMTAVWFSPDGLSWTRVQLEVPGPTHTFGLVGDGASIVVGGVAENQTTIWRWSGE